MLILYIMWWLNILEVKVGFCFVKHSICFWTDCEMCWSCCVEIRHEEGWSLYIVNETQRAGTHKHAYCRHYELRICQWISARMCSLSQPDITCQPLQVIAPSNSFIMSGVISEVGWRSMPVYHLGICRYEDCWGFSRNFPLCQRLACYT